MRLRLPAPDAELVALTLHVVGLLCKERKTCIKSGVTLLPDGTVTVKPPPIALLPAGQVAVPVAVVPFGSVTGTPSTNCSPASPGAPVGPAGPTGPAGPIGPAGPVAPTAPVAPVDPAGQRTIPYLSHLLVIKSAKEHESRPSALPVPEARPVRWRS